MTIMPLVDPPKRVRWWLRPALWLAARITGKDPLPGRLLAHAPKVAMGFGVFELLSAHAPADLDGRALAAARIVASVIAGCPFCIDMNAATWRTAGLTADELAALFEGAAEATSATRTSSDSFSSSALEPRIRLVARYAAALTQTPVHVSDELADALRRSFSARETVVLAATIAQVNTWARFNHGMGVPAAGFFDAASCPVSLRLPAGH